MSMNKFVKEFHHYGLPTQNMEDTIDFYKKLGADIVFETEVMENGRPCRVVHLKVSNLYIEAYERDSTPGVTGAVDHIAVSTDDIQGAFEEAKRLGLKFVNEEIGVSDYWPGTSKWFHLEGPNGEHIEFTQ